MSIAMGTRTKEHMKKDKITELSGSVHRDVENIMATGWGDDVFEQVSDDGLDSDSENDSDSGVDIKTHGNGNVHTGAEAKSSVALKSLALSDTSTGSHSKGKEMSDGEVNDRANRFKNFSQLKSAAKTASMSSPLTGSSHKRNSVSYGEDEGVVEVDMEGFAKIMDTLAMQPKIG